MIRGAPDLSKVEPLSEWQDDPEEEEVLQMAANAQQYVASFSWCTIVDETLAGIVIPGVVGVFLHKITPARPDVDEWVWSITGDLPPAYITVDECPNPATALDGYIGAMEEWVAAVMHGRSTAGLVPVNAPSTPEYAKMLSSRLAFLDSRVLSEYGDDLQQSSQASEDPSHA